MEQVRALMTVIMLYGQAFTAPFRPAVEPPRQVSGLTLDRFENTLLPSFVGGASGNSILEWDAACFRENSAWMVFHNNSGSRFGGGTLHIKVSNARNWTCVDLYVFSTPFRVTWDSYAWTSVNAVDFEEWESQEEYEYVKKKGVSIFFMPSGFRGTLRALKDVYPLFSNSERGERRNIDFLKSRMGATFVQRPRPAWIANVNPDDIKSGDMMVVSRLRGSWGARQSLQKWATGSYAGHAVVCLRDAQGKLWVAESGYEAEDGGDDIIVLLPWEEYWEMELGEDRGSPHIALLPLHPNIRAKFNETAAWEYAKSLHGTRYGYHNVMFSWIDTPKDNYPPPLDANVVAAAMTIWNRMKPETAGIYWDEALNKRLGTENLSVAEILVEVKRRGLSFDELLAIPEQDDWVYTHGTSVSCVAYVHGIYKAAGLYGELTNSIQATEFHVKDGYTPKFFENNSSRLPSWCNAGDRVKLPFCQILGKYRMELPDYNTIEPYANMNERCPSLAPQYKRPKGC